MWRRAAAAAVLAGVLAPGLGAQGLFGSIEFGGPLWWVPSVDDGYSRHHDRWYYSHFEALREDWRVATSFPTIPGEVVWASDVSGAPENSACDYQAGFGFDNVGPPYPYDGVLPPRAWPRVAPYGWTSHAAGGFAGLQMSMHISEWWQGLKYLEYFQDPVARAHHFSGHRAAFNPLVFGWFDVGMRDNAGLWDRPPLEGRHSVDWIDGHEGGGRWVLGAPGSGFDVNACLGVSMVNTHGVEDGGQDNVFPPLPRGADGGECWSAARPMVVRANSEARCEPDLAKRYPYTGRFYARFDAAPARDWIGESHFPLFPLDYSAPYLMARRGEIAVFTASELADASLPEVPWSALSYPSTSVEQRGTRADLKDRFLRSDRVDPFGGNTYGQGTVELYNSDLGVSECIELGEPGWDPGTGTLQVDCGHGRENSEYTGRVNRSVMGHGTQERSLEVGPLDNSRPVGGRAVARRSAGLWTPPAGFEWFEHRSATLGCLFLEAEMNDELVPAAELKRSEWIQRAQAAQVDYRLALARWYLCGDDDCLALESANIVAARAASRRAFRIAYGWEVIREYREEVMPLFEGALQSASPYGYGGSRDVLIANGRVLGPGGNACVTNYQASGYNEALIPSYPTYGLVPGGGIGWTGSSTVVPQGGPMWYGEAFEHSGAHPARGTDWGDAYAGWDTYTQFADVAGRTTPYSELVINPGSDYPAELRAYRNYNDVRTGSQVWRDFACKIVHQGYYGMGLTDLGTSHLDHREFPERAWTVPDPRVRLGDSTATQFSSGTPCVDDPAYDVRGADGVRRCFDYQTGVGAYSFTGHWNTDTDKFKLGYSGDGSSDTGSYDEVRVTRPTSYWMVNGSELFRLDLRTAFFNLRYGYRSLDLERFRIWPGYGRWSNPQKSSWLASGEAYAGAAPGGCLSPFGCDPALSPLDQGSMEHHGQLRSFGAMVIGGTGGCTLDIRGGLPVDGKPPQGFVMHPEQRILCLLSTDARPDGRCPGQNLP